MPSELEFQTARRVIFGAGSFSRAAEIGSSLGNRALVVTGRSAQRSLFAALRDGLAAKGVASVHYLVQREPTVSIADEGARLALSAGCDIVIGLGGGSALDAAKAIAGLMTNGGEALDYLEIVGRGRALDAPAAPFLAIPTTAGTGSEVTRNAVLTDPESRIKASIRSPHLLPSVALVDPDLMLGLPPNLTATTGLDALTQLIEAWITPRANAVSDLFALDGIARSARSLLAAVRNGDDRAAREDLALASLFGGFALANAGLGAVHGIAAPLGGRRPVTHGAACAILLPHVFAANLEALRATAPASPALSRMRKVGEILAAATSDDSNGSLHNSPPDRPRDPADAAVAEIRRIVAACGVPGLSHWGVTHTDIPPIVEGAMRSSSMKGNPVLLPAETLARLILAAL